MKLRLRYLVLTCILLANFQTQIQAQDPSIQTQVQVAQKKNLHKRLQWERFYYLHRGASLVLTEDFFLAPGHGSDLSLELTAFIKALNAEPVGDNHVYCKFPARSRWLIQELGIPEERFAKFRCDAYERYKSLVHPKSVWIAFASYYLNTPASAYGHTLLRLSQTPKEETHLQNDLLDYSITLGANNNTSNPIVYAVKGLFGGFTGNFVALPYYYKIREYNDFESRDIWSYSLNLSDAEIARLVDLIWELDEVYFPYYYLSKNCSSYLLALLDAVNEDFHFLDEMPIYAIPIETVKALYKRPGFVHSVDFRPSVRRQFWSQFQDLNDSEKHIYKDIIDIESASLPVLAYDEPTRVHLLDLALTQFDHLHPREIMEAKGAIYEKKRRYLVMRSQIPIKSETHKIEPKKGEDPAQGHSPGKYTLSLGGINYGTRFDRYVDMGVRFSLHDLNDPQEGHFFSRLNMFDFALRYYQHGSPRVRLHKATFFEIFNLSPWNEFEHKGSWQAELAFKDFIEPECLNCYGVRLAGAYGLAVEPLWEHRPAVYALFGGRLDAFRKHDNSYRGSPALGPTIGLWSKAYLPGDSFQMEFSRFYLPLAKADQSLPWVSTTTVRYNLALGKSLRAHLNYENKGPIYVYELGLSSFM